jgi:hypothetical protein
LATEEERRIFYRGNSRIEKLAHQNDIASNFRCGSWTSTRTEKSSAPFEWIPVACLNCCADALSHGNRVGRFPLQESAQYGELRPQHVTFKDGSQRLAGSGIDPVGCVM